MQLLESLTNYPNRTIAKAARDTFLVFFRVSCWPFFLWWQNCSRCENMDSGKPLNSDMWSVLTDHLSYCILWAYQAVLHKELLWFSMSSVQTARWRHIISWLRTPLNGYRELYRAASTMKVVNDSAERAIALMQQYNSSLTKNKEQKQFLLCLVEKQRKQYPTCTKSALTNTGENEEWNLLYS